MIGIVVQQKEGKLYIDKEKTRCETQSSQQHFSKIKFALMSDMATITL